MQYSKQELRKFGLLVGGIFLAIGAYLLWRKSFDSPWGKGFAVFGTGLILFGAAVPAVLAPIYRGWMLIAHVLGWINTRIILGVIFYVGFALTRLYLVLTGNDPMQRRPDKTHATYWLDVTEPFERESLEHPF